MVIDRLDPQGAGALQAAFDTLKKLDEPFRQACPLLGEEDPAPWDLAGAIYRLELGS